MCLVFGIGFQMPVVVVVLAKTGIVSLQNMKKWRKYVLFIIVVAGGILSPAPDFMSNILLAGSIYLLYEVGLLFAARSTRTQRVRPNDSSP